MAFVRSTHLAERPVLVRADSAFYGSPTVLAALKAGARVSVTARMDPRVRATIAQGGSGPHAFRGAGANAAWLVLACMTFNLMRASGALTGAGQWA
jgi:hypothetical protein